jgi:hypothetical protein
MRHFRANLLAIPIILLASWFSIQIRSGIAQQKENLDICSEDSLKTLILGDSHARTALNPEFIGSACSSAQKAEELEYSYYKLKRALETHEEIENLIITVSYFNFLAPVDTESEMMKRYHRLLDTDFYAAKKKYQEYQASHAYRNLINHKLPQAVPIGLLNELVEDVTQPLFRGGYELRQGSLIGQDRALNAAIQRHYYQGKKLRQGSKLRAAYFGKIVQLCKSQQVRLYVVNTPLHPHYQAQVPPAVISGYEDIITQHSEDFVYLDYSSLKLPDALFFDYDHLNAEGARLFSGIIRQDLSQEATNSRRSRLDYSRHVAHNISQESEENVDETP